jgi:hypothetical protein
MIETLTPFGVGSEYSWRRSGCCAGQRVVIAKADRSDIRMLTEMIFCRLNDQVFYLARANHEGCGTRAAETLVQGNLNS